MATHNSQFKSFAVAHSDAATPGSFANGFAILSQTNPPQLRRLTGCYAPSWVSVFTIVVLLIIGLPVSANANLFLYEKSIAEDQLPGISGRPDLFETGTTQLLIYAFTHDPEEVAQSKNGMILCYSKKLAPAKAFDPQLPNELTLRIGDIVFRGVDIAGRLPATLIGRSENSVYFLQYWYPNETEKVSVFSSIRQLTLYGA